MPDRPLHDAPAAQVRASDADRERVASELRGHCVEGRLTVEELEERLELAYGAVAVGELDRLVRDLPGDRAKPGGRRHRTRVGPPGNVPFTRRVELPASAARIRAEALQRIAPGLNASGYELASQSPHALVFERSARPRWVPFVAIFAFPLGLVALAVRQTQRIVLSLEEQTPERTVLIVHGVAPRGVRKAFAELAED